MDDAGGRPGSHDVVRVHVFEPSGKSSRVAASLNDPSVLNGVCLLPQSVLGINKVGNISQSLGRVEPLKIFYIPVVERLRSAIESVLEHNDLSLHGSGCLMGERSVCEGLAGPLSTDRKEYNTSGVIIVLVIDPHTLLISHVLYLGRSVEVV